MQAPLLYQVSEYDCVPTTLINAVESASKRSKELGEMMVKDFMANNGK